MDIKKITKIGEALSELTTSDLEMLNHMYGSEIEDLVGIYSENNPLSISDFQGGGEDLILAIGENCGEDGLFLDADDVLQNTVNLLGGEADWTDILETLRSDNSNVYDHFVDSLKKYLKEEAENGAE